MRALSALHSCVMMRWSCGLRAENVTNSRTSSLAPVSSSTSRDLRDACVHRPLEQIEQRVDRRPPQLVLRPVVVVEQRLRHSGARRDLTGRRAVERPLGEQVDRRGEDPVAGRVGRRPREPAPVTSVAAFAFAIDTILIS